MRYLIVLFALMLGACSYIGPASDKVAEKLGEGVAKYCEEFDEQARQRVKDKVGPAVAPHSISVECAP